MKLINVTSTIQYSKNLLVSEILTYCYLAIGVLAFFSQITCIVVFTRTRAHSKVFVYLQAYSVNSLIICLLISFKHSYQLWFMSDCLVSMIMARVTIPVLTMCNFNNGFLIMMFLVDRLSIFEEKIRNRMTRFSPRYIFTIIILSSLIVCWPSVLLVTVRQESTKFILVPSKFMRSTLGAIFIFFLTLICDILVATMKLVLNIISIRHIKQHVRRRAYICRHTTIWYQVDQVRIVIMVVVMSIMSISEHLLLSYSLVDIIFKSDHLIIFGHAQDFTLTFMTARRLLDIVFYFVFNSVFKKECLKLIGYKSSSINK